jgi:hypothetical protein
VPVLDPAIAPLGTDDEAAGAPPAPQLVAAVRARERATPPPKGPADPTGQPYGGRGGPRLSLALLALVGLGAAALWLSLG